MRRKITVYGLRFSKTTFWNRINTGFLDPAVATVLTACGIETNDKTAYYITLSPKLQQYLPLAVLKQEPVDDQKFVVRVCCNSTYRLRY